jgi:hypothetical protein
MATEANGGFGWDDKIDPTEKERVLLPEGVAMFGVIKLERTRGNFSDCGTVNIAKLTLSVTSLVDGAPEGPEEIQINLPLVTKMKWKMVQFFTSIGQRKHGDAGEFQPNWAKVEGETGGCIVAHRDWKKKDGSTIKVNDIAKFTSTEEAADNLTF